MQVVHVLRNNCLTTMKLIIFFLSLCALCKISHEGTELSAATFADLRSENFHQSTHNTRRNTFCLYIQHTLSRNMSKHSLLTTISIPGHIFVDVNTKYSGIPL
jgi:hypothetical protein